MLRKNRPIAFIKPMSTMRRVYESIEGGSTCIKSIKDGTGLKTGQVQSAVWNLRFIGVITKVRDIHGRATYYIEGRAPVAECLKGVSSIFNVPLPRS